MLDINKIQDLALKASTLNDTKSFEFLQNSLTELKSSSNPKFRFLALRIENQLKENQNYNDYVTQQEVKKAASNVEEQREQRETQKQQLNATSAKLQQDKKKAEAFKNEQDELKQLKQLNDQVAYNQKINMIFAQLSIEQQTSIKNLEHEFKEENQQLVRNFVLDKTQTEQEAGQNLHKIISHEVGEEYVRYDDRTASIDFSMQTPPELLKQTADKTQKLGDVALDNNNLNAATSAYITTNNATATEAAQNANKAEEFAKNTLQIKNGEELNIAKVQGFIGTIFEETYPKYQQQIDKIKDTPKLTDEQKQERIKHIEEKLQSELESKAAADIDLNNPKIKDYLASFIAKKEDVNQEQQEQIAKLLKIDEDRLKEQQKEQREAKETQEKFLDEIDGPATTPKKEEKIEEVKTNEQEQEKGKLKEEDLNDLLTAKNEFRTDPDPNSEKIANKAADIMQMIIEGRNQKMIEDCQQPDNKPSYAEEANKRLREMQKEQEQQELNQQNNNNANLSSQK